MWIFYFSVTQNQTQISSKTRRILKIAIPKLSKEMLKTEHLAVLPCESLYYFQSLSFLESKLLLLIF